MTYLLCPAAVHLVQAEMMMDGKELPDMLQFPVALKTDQQVQTTWCQASHQPPHPLAHQCQFPWQLVIVTLLQQRSPKSSLIKSNKCDRIHFLDFYVLVIYLI